MIEISLNVLISINILLLFLLLILFSFLLVQKNRNIKRKKRKEKLKKNLQKPLFKYLNEGNEIKTRLFQREPISYESVQELLSEYNFLAKGDEVTERVQKFAEMYFADYYRELIEHKNWSIRMNTLYSIEEFGIMSLENAVWESFITNGRDRVEKHQKLRILARLQSERLIEHLFSNTVEEYPSALYKEMLRRFSTDRFDQIVGSYDQANASLKIATLAMFAEKKDTSYLPLVERELENGQSDIRIQALKVLRSFGYVGNIDLLATFAKSSLWQERMMFCKISSVLKKERFKPFLVQLIADENWWVRNGAGEALANLQDGKIILTHIVETNKDSFARDMAQQWLGGVEIYDE